MEGNISVRSTILGAFGAHPTEPRFTDSTRDFTVDELRQLGETLFNLILAVPQQKMRLATIGSAEPGAYRMTLEQHTEPSCGTTFCVLGWAATVPEIASNLGIFPVFDRSSMNIYSAQTDLAISYDDIFFVNGKKTFAGDFLFSANVTNDSWSYQEYDKQEALLRAAVLIVSLDPSRDPYEDMNPLVTPGYYTDYGPKFTYAKMHELGLLDKCIDLVAERSGMDVTHLREWRDSNTPSVWEESLAEYADNLQDFELEDQDNDDED